MATETTPDELVAHYQPILPDMWSAKIQQTQNALLPYVTNKPLDGKVTFLDQINPLDAMRQKTQRFQRLEIEENTYDKRAIFWSKYDKTMGFDEDDDIKLGRQTLPVAETMTEMANLAHRTVEAGIIAAITGTNYAGEGGATPITLGSDRIIDYNFNYDGSTTARGMTVDKFARARRIYMKDYAYGQGLTNGTDQLVAALSAANIESMLQDAKMNDKMSVFALEKLQNFEVDSFMGVKILHTEQAPTRLQGDDVIRQVPFWLKSRVKFGFAINWKIKMWVEEMLSDAILMRGQVAFGGSRTEEKGVLLVEALETAL